MSDEMENDRKEHHDRKWLVSDDADNTRKLIGGLIIFGLTIVGLFVLEIVAGNPKAPIYLKEATVLTTLAYIAGWISGSSGKKNNGGG